MSARHRRRRSDHPVAIHRAALKGYSESMERGILPFARLLMVRYLRETLLPRRVAALTPASSEEHRSP
jgi:hypothetical protein